MNLRRFVLGLAWVCAATLRTAQANDVATLLALGKAPDGVAFEIVEGSPERLAPALERVRRDVATLRARFPGLPVAVVSHGREQFALLHAARAQHPVAHDLSHGLRNDGVELSVCATHAQRHGHEAGDFPEFIDVSPEGPARLRDLAALGYVRIRVRMPR